VRFCSFQEKKRNRRTLLLDLVAEGESFEKIERINSNKVKKRTSISSMSGRLSALFFFLFCEQEKSLFEVQDMRRIFWLEREKGCQSSK